MSLDIPTLFVIAVFVSAVAGFLLLLSWLQNRNVRGLALWASSLIIGSIGVALIAARGDISDTWSIAIANAILATAYGMMWAGARNFDGRPTSAPLVFAGAVIWLAACRIEAFFTSPQARTALMSVIVVSYSLLSAWELWRGRREGLIFRLPVILLLLVHAAFFVVRIPLAGALPLPTDSEEIPSGWWTFTMFEGVFFAFCIPYLLGAMARERIVLKYKHASLIDPLTGVGAARSCCIGTRLTVDPRCCCCLISTDSSALTTPSVITSETRFSWAFAAPRRLRCDLMIFSAGSAGRNLPLSFLTRRSTKGSSSPSAFVQTSRRQRWRLARIHRRQRSASE
jgi:hypothetical protein